MKPNNRPVQSHRIAADIDALAQRTEPDHKWTRRAFTPHFLDGRAYLRERMVAAGLEVRVDAAGNLIGRRAGRLSGSGTLMLGSHSDTVPAGGRFDGIAGVVAGLEVVRALSDAGVALDHDLEVVDFLAEEVSLFGVSCVGSRAIGGRFDPAWLKRQYEGRSLEEGIREVGGTPETIAAARRDDVRAFLELHIEQGPVLEQENLQIGVVSAIVGITRIELKITGRADHAGTTPMSVRRDALVAAADMVSNIRSAADDLAAQPGHFVATVGEFRMKPNAANVVPSEVELLIDARAEHRPRMDEFLARLNERVAALVAMHDVTIEGPTVISDNPAVTCDLTLRTVLSEAANGVGLSHRELASGAGHDAAWITRVAPSAMVFIPCLGGRSHTPEEWTETESIAQGTLVLYDTIRRLDVILAGVSGSEAAASER